MMSVGGVFESWSYWKYQVSSSKYLHYARLVSHPFTCTSSHFQSLRLI